MDISNSVNSIVVPRWVKAAVAVLLVVLICAYALSVVIGIIDQERSGWLEAGAYLLGVLVPILIIVLVVGFSEGGVAALTVRTQEFLTKVLPERFPGLEEPATKFVRLGSSSLRRRRPKPVRTLVQHSPGSCVANYKVQYHPDGGSTLKEINFRIELNARKVNFNIMFEEHLMSDAKIVSPQSLFPHSISGAEKSGYWFNPELISREIEGVTHICLVGTKSLEDNFLVNPVAKLDLAQDLILMLRSFVHENPMIFASIAKAQPGKG